MSEPEEELLDDGRSVPMGFHQLVLDHVQAAVIVHSASSKITYANAPAAQIFGCSILDLIGSASIDFVSRLFDVTEKPLPVSQYPVSRVLSTGQAVRSLVVGVQRLTDSGFVWVLCNAYPMSDLGIDSAAVVVCFTDVSDLRRSESALRESKERLDLVIQGTRDASWDVDLATTRTHLSPQWFEMLGLTTDDEGDAFRPMFDYVYPPDRDRISLYTRNSLISTSSFFEIEFRLPHASGRPIPVLARAIISRNEEGIAVRISGSVRNMTDSKVNEERIRKLALFDIVTALPNRWLFLERLNMAQNASAETAQYGAVYLLDLDRFKIVNEKFSHRVGDEVLRQVGFRIANLLTEADTVARMGGDEFAIIVQDLHSDSAAARIAADRFAESVLESIAEPFHLETAIHRLTASIGVSLFKGRDLIQEDVGRRIDLAMYAAKSGGRNTWRFFEDSLLEAFETEIALDKELGQVVENNELRLFFQAQVDSLGAIDGAEVLLRWAHPSRGLIPPNDFIEAAEKSGAIVAIGYWVIQQACSQLVEWAENPAFRHLCLSINVSVRQFQEDDFADRVIDTVLKSGAPVHQLKLEITETLLVRDFVSVSAKMAQISATGIAFSLDDFGVGYSSLLHLQKLPLDEIKIDRMFVRDLGLEAKDRVFARLIIEVGAQLGLRVVAEGVETNEQREWLASEGCRHFQGFLFHKPCPILEFVEFCSARAVNLPTS